MSVIIDFYVKIEKKNHFILTNDKSLKFENIN